MLPFQPETLEAIKRRLPAAYCMSECPGGLREHVFDFEEGVRCIISLQKVDEIYLHVSFSPHKSCSLPVFLQRVDQIPTELWPDTILVEVWSNMTNRAIHCFYKVPSNLISCLVQSNSEGVEPKCVR